MKRVLVTDGHWRKTLAAVRGLGREGLTVELCESSRFCTAKFSRYCHRFHLAPTPYQTDRYVRWLKNHLWHSQYEFLLPMEEVTCLLLAENPGIVPKWTKMVLPSHEQLTTIADKRKAYEIAKELDLPVPVTHEVKSMRDMMRLNMPLIIRPRTGSGTVGVAYVEDHEEAQTHWFKHDQPLVQDIIEPGHGLGVAVLMNHDSEPRAVFCHERMRENPPRGGPSTLAVSTRHPEAEEYAVRLLRSINWVGIAQVEFRVDENGRPIFIEVNPRFWGTLQLPIAAGVNFPYLLYRLAMDGDVDPVTSYRLGLHFRWILPGDILHLLRNKRRFRDLFSYSKHLMGRNVTHAIFDPEDPMPVLGRLLAAPQFLGERLFGR